MARRYSSSSRRRSGSSSRASSASGASAGAGSSRARRAAAPNGKVNIACPQCGTAYRVGQDMLDSKIECTECHRVFFAKTTAGKRVQAPDYTKAYIGFGVLGLVIVGIFVAMSMSGSKRGNDARAQKPAEPAKPSHSIGTHPRAQQLSKWAQALSTNNQLSLGMHTDTKALASQLGVAEGDSAAVIQALLSHESTELLRTMDASSAELASEADMEGQTGSGRIFVTPKAGDERFKRNTNGIFDVTFKMDGANVQVASFRMTREPVYAAGKAPGVVTYTPNEDIAKPTVTEVSDSAGTRQVKESEPAPVPHWDKATPEQREMADKVVADIIQFARDPEAPGGLFNNATLRVRSMEQKQAAVPRVLNAMYECYSDVVANHETLILLDKALQQWTGYGVNYPRLPSGNAENDKTRRQSCIRQWFAFWYRYHEDLSEFFNTSENLEGGDEDGGK